MMRSFDKKVQNLGLVLKDKVISEKDLWKHLKENDISTSKRNEVLEVLEDEYNVTVLLDDYSLKGTLSSSVMSEYARVMGMYPVFSEEEESRYLNEYNRTGSKEIKDKIILHNLRLVLSIVSRYNYPTIDTEDLFNEGITGLMTAIDKFDVSRGLKLSTYASHWIRQAVTRYISQNCKGIRLPVWLDEKIKKANAYVKKYALENNGEVPTDKQVADKLGISPVYWDIYKVYANYNVHSLNKLVNRGDGDEGETEVGDFIPSMVTVENEVFSVCLSEDIDEVLSNLPDREERVLRLRYGLDGTGRQKTLQECSTYLNVTRERVRQIESKAFRKLRSSRISSKLKAYCID